MIYLVNDIKEPAVNHAIEEYFLEETDEEVFSLWQNVPTVLLGKNQDAYAEVNIDYANRAGIKIVRRLSGGGTVYCDLKNMQYTFISSAKKFGGVQSFSKFASPIVEALCSLGLNAEFTGRNDILVEGKKVSGNAQYRHGTRVLHHGTLLFDLDGEALKNALYSRPIKFSNKKVASVSARVGTLSEFLPNMSVQQFMQYLTDYVIRFYDIKKVITVDDDLLAQAEKYKAKFLDAHRNLGEKYGNRIQMSVKYDFGLVEYKVLLEDKNPASGSGADSAPDSASDPDSAGNCSESANKLIIKDIKILGDYFENCELDEFLTAFKGVLFNESELKKVLETIDVSKYISNMTNDILLSDLLTLKKGV